MTGEFLHKRPVTQKMFTFDDDTMVTQAHVTAAPAEIDGCVDTTP